LSGQLYQLITGQIEQFYLTRPKPNVAQLIRSIRHACHEHGLFHRLGRLRDRGLEDQQTRAAALNLVTAAIVLFNCRYLDRALASMRMRDLIADEGLVSKLSPLGWDHINLTGDYVWSDALTLDADGFFPLKPALA